MRTVICIGSVLWDIIGRTDGKMAIGYDRPGRITRMPGGVALNIAMALRAQGLPVALLSHLGSDPAGQELLKAIAPYGFETQYLTHSQTLPTDAYMAIESPDGMIAAIADANALEAAGDTILSPLRNGELGAADQPFDGQIVLDGNLTLDLLGEIASDPEFQCAKLHLAPASPGKAERMHPFLDHPRTTLYINLIEACLIARTSFETSSQAAQYFAAGGLERVVITDGPNPASVGSGNNIYSATPPKVKVRRFTGAGDCFMAAFIAALGGGANNETALNRAIDYTADHISKSEGS